MYQLSNSNNPFPSSALRIGRTNPLAPLPSPHAARRPPSFRINCNQKEGHECSPPLSWCAMLKICPTVLSVCEFVCMCCVVQIFVHTYLCTRVCASTQWRTNDRYCLYRLRFNFSWQEKFCCMLQVWVCFNMNLMLR